MDKPLMLLKWKAKRPVLDGDKLADTVVQAAGYMVAVTSDHIALATEIDANTDEVRAVTYVPRADLIRNTEMVPV